ncbi:hypothetical protein ERD95_15710 [Enterobacteriaceae bacterium ML5]|nr:hypothetical protein ERD95_15710 [Enterobacteriaceae bacterium ML5]
MKFAATTQNFTFDLSQLVNMRISEEWGEVRARAQYSHDENQYLIHYKAADGCARDKWFAESVLTAVEHENHPGCAVYAGVELPADAQIN